MSSDKPIQSGPNASNETWETTAQRAKAEASTVELSDEVDRNARREAEAAKQAAGAAPYISPDAMHRSLLIPQAFDDIGRGPSLRTQGAADEGERNGPEAVFIDIDYPNNGSKSQNK